MEDEEIEVKVERSGTPTEGMAENSDTDAEVKMRQTTTTTTTTERRRSGSVFLLSRRESLQFSRGEMNLLKTELPVLGTSPTEDPVKSRDIVLSCEPPRIFIAADPEPPDTPPSDWFFSSRRFSFSAPVLLMSEKVSSAADDAHKANYDRDGDEADSGEGADVNTNEEAREANEEEVGEANLEKPGQPNPKEAVQGKSDDDHLLQPVSSTSATDNPGGVGRAETESDAEYPRLLPDPSQYASYNKYPSEETTTSSSAARAYSASRLSAVASLNRSIPLPTPAVSADVCVQQELSHAPPGDEECSYCERRLVSVRMRETSLGRWRLVGPPLCGRDTNVKILHCSACGLESKREYLHVAPSRRHPEVCSIPISRRSYSVTARDSESPETVGSAPTPSSEM